MAVEIKKILVGNDLTEEASRVVRYALELAVKFHAQVYVLHIMPTVDPAVLNMVALNMGADKLARLNKENEAELVVKTKEQIQQIIQQETELMDEEVAHPPKIEVHHGEAVPLILKTADRLDVDLIVLGSHSKGRLHYAFLGSVAEKILRKCHRTVMIVPPLKG
jgi:nucleotide-binding universal stress UspA family protein